MSTVLKKARELFAAGTWNGISFTEDDLDGIVNAFDALKMAGAVPLKLGHVTPTPRNPERQFAMGWVNKIYRAGSKLLGDLEVPARVADLLEEKFLKFVSVELAQDVKAGTRVLPWVLDAVALLGTEHPAVGVLKELQAVTMSRKPVLLGGRRVTFRRQVSKHQSEVKAMDEDKVKELLAEQEKKLTAVFSKQVDDIKKASDEAVKAAKEAERKTKVDARKAAIKAMFSAAIEGKKLLPRTQERFEKSYMRNDDAVLDIKDEEVQEFIKSFADVDAPEIKKLDASSGKGRKEEGKDDDKAEFSGKTNTQVFAAKVEKELLRVGGKINSSADHRAAAQRVMKAEPKLAQAYLDEPHADYAAQEG